MRSNGLLNETKEKQGLHPRGVFSSFIVPMFLWTHQQNNFLECQVPTLHAFDILSIWLFPITHYLLTSTHGCAYERMHVKYNGEQGL